VPMLRSAVARSVSRSALTPIRRQLCSSDVSLKNAYVTMQLHPGATTKQIKKKFYELAKSTHPDVHQGATAKAQETAKQGPVIEHFDQGVLQAALDPVARFLEVQTAYEILMEAAESGTAQAGGRRRQESAPKARAKTLGEVLVERLVEEPEEVEAVWGDIVAQHLSVSVPMIERLFKAHAYHGRAETNRGMSSGLALILQGVDLGIISQTTRSAAMVHLLTGWKNANEDYVINVVIEHVTDADRESTAVMAAIGAVFCSGTRSPY